jgi:hypothetical protein
MNTSKCWKEVLDAGPLIANFFLSPPN